MLNSLALSDSFIIQKPKAILFDWDNTLVDTTQLYFDCLNGTFSALGMPVFTPEEFHSHPPLSMRDGGPALFGDRLEEAEKIFYGLIEELHLKELKALEGAYELVSSLQHLDVFVGIVSNKRGNYLRREVDHLGWTPHFQSIIGSRDAAEDKPSILPVKMALEKSGIDHGADVWFVGDSIVDVQCAQRAGCVPIIVGSVISKDHENIFHLGDCKGVADLLLKF